MAVHNGSKWLREAIQSVLLQTFEDFELIVINDGSTDDTRVIAESLSEKDQRIIVINRQKYGLTDSLNFGIQIARGEWIARLDADDIAEPSRLQRQLEVVQSDRSIVLLGTGFSYIDEIGNVTAFFPRVGKVGNTLHDLVNGQGRIFPHSSAFFSSKAALLVGGYRSKFRRSQDKDLWLRLSRLGRLEIVNEVLVKIRRHTGQISHDDSGKIQLIDSHIATISYLAVNYGLTDPVDYCDDEFTFFRAWVEKQLHYYRMFEIREWQYKIQTHLIRRKFHKYIYIIIRAFMNPVILVYYLKLRAFGNRLPQKLAVEWFKCPAFR